MSLEINEYGTMGKDAINEVDKMLLNNRLLQLMLAGILLVLLILSYGYYTLANEKSVTISMPPYGEFEVARMKADPLYYRVFGDYVLSNMASFNSSTIKDKLVRAASIFERETYLLKKSEFDNYYRAIVTNKIEQEYRYDENTVEVALKDAGARAEVTYKGYAEQKIANITKIKKQCDYKFSFFLNDGRIFQDGVYTNCLDNESIKTLDKEEKEALDGDRESIVREAQKQDTDKKIDKKVIERESLNKDIKSDKDFKRDIIERKKQKLVDSNELLGRINAPQDSVSSNQASEKQTEAKAHLKEQSENAIMPQQKASNTQEANLE